MTNHWIDIKNADCIMIIGSNAAENHPISFRWVSQAIDKGAKLISVDPRFTRTSARADLYVPIRSGTDIAFIGAIINYILQNDFYNREYLHISHAVPTALINFLNFFATDMSSLRDSNILSMFSNNLY